VKLSAKVQQPVALKDLGSFVLYNNTMYINERNKGIHVIDYSNPVSPVNKGFIPIPGNLGVSIKNNVMYADCYSDLFVFNIQSNENIQFQKSIDYVFPGRYGYLNYDTNYVKLKWIKKDTTVTQEYYDRNYDKGLNYDTGVYATTTSNQSSAASSVPTNGNSIGSSMAVFAIINDYLYTVDQSKLNTFSLKDALNPVKENSQQVGWNIETIFPFKDKLFIGSTTGMFIYSLVNPSLPAYVSVFNHVRACDPVIADDKFAFVTVRSGAICGGSVNQLDVLNIENIATPTLLKSLQFSNPHGLSKDGNVLFVCDGNSGLKVVDATDVNNLIIKQSLSIGKAIDVVALNQKAFVMLENGIQIYSYNQQFNLTLLSTITKN
jgi:hypothetical protein